MSQMPLDHWPRPKRSLKEWGRVAIPLFKLRVVVARYGELDNAGWWNTKGQLGHLGASVLRRGFRRTYRFAAARSVFAVAADRCAELVDEPNAMHLFDLPPRQFSGVLNPVEPEELLDQCWEYWCESAPEWEDFFEQVEVVKVGDLVATLRSFGLVTKADVTALRSLRIGKDASRLRLPGTYTAKPAQLKQLALAFALGGPGRPTVPYALRRREAECIP